MPRIERGLVDGFIYHILNRGNGGQEVFHKKQDYEAFIKLMHEGKKLNPIIMLAYCLMPNHFHMVIKTIHAEELSKFMQWVMTSHVRRYHAHYKTHGHVWQGRFKSFLVNDDEYLLTALRYVEANPIRTGLTATAKEWLWSSHTERLGGKERILNKLPINLPANWANYVNEPLNESELNRIRQSVIRQAPYGPWEWCEKIVEKLGIESTIKPRGRPKHTRSNRGEIK